MKLRSRISARISHKSIYATSSPCILHYSTVVHFLSRSSIRILYTTYASHLILHLDRLPLLIDAALVSLTFVAYFLRAKLSAPLGEIGGGALGQASALEQNCACEVLACGADANVGQGAPGKACIEPARVVKGIFVTAARRRAPVLGSFLSRTVQPWVPM